MTLQLYADLTSEPCRSVYIFLKMNNIPFEMKLIRLSTGEQYSEEFRKVNPLRRIPVIKDEDFVLVESVAILKYLACKYQTPDHWYPADLQKRARVDEYLAWQHTELRPQAGKVFMVKGMSPVLAGEPVPEDRLKEVVDELTQSLKKFEEKFLQDKPYIVGAEISLADLVAIVELMQPLGAGYDPLKGSATLTAWHDRVKTAVGRDLFDKTHEPILKSTELLKSLSQTQPDTLQALKTNLLKYCK
ncbi:glutathione S-transferase theta-1-like [Heterodontus francisci]|uniref:glutathione S-transferase theta-1-like n=1 Tax=Heterodontus francisci TaxID=7792 RepID=UPI00355BC393